jgi:hypothetical protein
MALGRLPQETRSETINRSSVLDGSGNICHINVEERGHSDLIKRRVPKGGIIQKENPYTYTRIQYVQHPKER